MPFGDAVKDTASNLDVEYKPTISSGYSVAPEGNLGGNHVTPRSLSSTLIGQARATNRSVIGQPELSCL